MITKKNIDKLLAMPDDRMAAMLRVLLTTAGVDTSGMKFDEKTTRKIRAVLSELTDDDLARVSYLSERYRRG